MKIEPSNVAIRGENKIEIKGRKQKRGKLQFCESESNKEDEHHDN